MLRLTWLLLAALLGASVAADTPEKVRYGMDEFNHEFQLHAPLGQHYAPVGHQKLLARHEEAVATAFATFQVEGLASRYWELSADQRSDLRGAYAAALASVCSVPMANVTDLSRAPGSVTVQDGVGLALDVSVLVSVPVVITSPLAKEDAVQSLVDMLLSDRARSVILNTTGSAAALVGDAKPHIEQARAHEWYGDHTPHRVKGVWIPVALFAFLALVCAGIRAKEVQDGRWRPLCASPGRLLEAEDSTAQAFKRAELPPASAGGLGLPTLLSGGGRLGDKTAAGVYKPVADADHQVYKPVADADHQV